ncbi:MAG: nucleoside deaminase [Prevotellaceae bacterium]|nr:nucleoside deaminase [Prevotellaceae bacterium]MDD7657718.1 nucleoside deaminase [Prevotellaceae bacterium]MDY5674480.1 nucleoside deaminase [Bacteroidaceae bacterium]
MKVSDIQSSSLKDCTSKLQQVAEAQSEFMQIAIQEAREGISNGDGGPFGTAIVRDGVLIASGHNHVLAYNDPTCHGEVDAIRKACKRLGTFDLTGCELYTTGEPCHMCLCACMWANISKIYYGCTIADNEIIGFRDNKFDQIFGGRDKLGDYMTEIDREACLRLFQDYSKMDATKY